MGSPRVKDEEVNLYNPP